MKVPHQQLTMIFSLSPLALPSLFVMSFEILEHVRRFTSLHFFLNDSVVA